jgi:hypothetical protein
MSLEYSDFMVGNNKTYLGLQVMSLTLFFSILAKSGISLQIFVEVPNIKFHINPFSGSRADTRGQTARQTDEGTTGLAAWYHLQRRGAFYGDLMLPATIGLTPIKPPSA